MKRSIIFSVCLLIIFWACDKEKAERDYPRVHTFEPQKITAEGVTLKGHIYDADNQLVEDHGFVYNLKSGSSNLTQFGKELNHVEGHFEKESLGSLNGDGYFESTLTRNLIRDTTYFAKAYAITKGTIVYGETIEFVSKGGIAPVIASFEPEVAYFGDTIKIVGNNFSNQIDYNTIKFDKYNAKLVSASDTVLKAIVPSELNLAKCNLRLKVGDDLITSFKKFSISHPQIDSISLKLILSGRWIDIYGRNFNTIKVMLIAGRWVSLYSVDISDNHFRIKVPDNIPVGKIPVTFRYLNDTIVIPDALESTKPTIESIKPLKVFTDTIFQIRGTYLNNLSSLRNYMGYAHYYSDTLILTKVKYVPSTNKVSCKYNGETIMAKDSIEWLPPVINSVDKKIAMNGENITISGDRFIEGLSVHFGEKSARVEFINKNSIMVQVPEMKSGTYPLKVTHYSNTFKIRSDVTVTIPELKITGVNPTSFKRGDIIDVYVENFNPAIYCYAKVDSCGATVDGVYDDHISVRIRSWGKELTSTPTVSVHNGGRKATFTEGLQGQESWEYLGVEEDPYINSDSDRITYVNGVPMLFVRRGYSDDYQLCQFEASTNSWNILSTFNSGGNRLSTFSSGNTIYVAYIDHLGDNNYKFNLESYSVDNDEWTHEKEFDCLGEELTLIAFKKDDMAYIGSKEFMKAFNLNTKQWEDKPIIPTDEERIYSEYNFICNNRCFVMINNHNQNDDDSKSELWEYNTNNDTWNYIAGCPIPVDYGSSCCDDGDKAYFYTNKGYDPEKAFMSYDPSTNIWEKYLKPSGSFDFTFLFNYNNHVYFGGYDGYNREMQLKKADYNDLIKLDD